MSEGIAGDSPIATLPASINQIKRLGMIEKEEETIELSDIPCLDRNTKVRRIFSIVWGSWFVFNIPIITFISLLVVIC